MQIEENSFEIQQFVKIDVEGQNLDFKSVKKALLQYAHKILKFIALLQCMTRLIHYIVMIIIVFHCWKERRLAYHGAL